MNSMEENKDNQEDLDLMSKHWKRIPVIGTQVFVENLPYILSPWDHWNKIVDKLKEEIQNKPLKDSEDIEDIEDIMKDNNDDTESLDVQVSSDINSIENDQDDVSTGYHTEMSEGDFTSGEVSDVDWETDNDDF